jgi:hypothetical protein
MTSRPANAFLTIVYNFLHALYHVRCICNKPVSSIVTLVLKFRFRCQPICHKMWMCQHSQCLDYARSRHCGIIFACHHYSASRERWTTT